MKKYCEICKKETEQVKSVDKGSYRCISCITLGLVKSTCKNCEKEKGLGKLGKYLTKQFNKIQKA